MDVVSLTVGLLGGGLISWLVAHLYYRRQLRGQEQAYRILQGDLARLPDRLIDALVSKKIIGPERVPEVRGVMNVILEPVGATATATVGNPVVVVGPTGGQEVVTDDPAKQALQPEDRPPGKS